MSEAQNSSDAQDDSAPRFPLGHSLSGRLLLLTIVFVMIAEILIYFPSTANFRVTWLEERLAAAQIASLSLEATMGEDVREELEKELLENARVLQVILHRNQTRMLMLARTDLPMVDQAFDLRERNPLILVRDAMLTLFAEDRVILVKGTPGYGGGELIEAVIDETELRSAMYIYSRNILSLSIIISLLTAILVFLSLRTILVQPMRRITENMISFRRKPEDASRIIEPKSNVLEVRTAEQELATMQTRVRKSLNQQARLAALGTAVSKINHDLRNILASAQLVSDMLATSEDPKVQRLAPRLVGSIDRAVNLATNTLKFGKVDEPTPQKSNIELAKLVDQVGDQLGLPEDGHITWKNAVESSLHVYADSDQLFRILLNLSRNAAQAIDSSTKPGQIDEIQVKASPADYDGRSAISIDVSDTGPGIPENGREHLFEAFSASERKGGTGLGLAIAKELTLAHGGVIDLLESSPNGTSFRVTLPNEK